MTVASCSGWAAPAPAGLPRRRPDDEAQRRPGQADLPEGGELGGHGPDLPDGPEPVVASAGSRRRGRDRRPAAPAAPGGSRGPGRRRRTWRCRGSSGDRLGRCQHHRGGGRQDRLHSGDGGGGQRAHQERGTPGGDGAERQRRPTPAGEADRQPRQQAGQVTTRSSRGGRSGSRQARRDPRCRPPPGWRCRSWVRPRNLPRATSTTGTATMAAMWSPVKVTGRTKNVAANGPWKLRHGSLVGQCLADENPGADQNLGQADRGHGHDEPGRGSCRRRITTRSTSAPVTVARASPTTTEAVRPVPLRRQIDRHHGGDGRQFGLASSPSGWPDRRAPSTPPAAPSANRTPLLQHHARRGAMGDAAAAAGSQRPLLRRRQSPVLLALRSTPLGW